MIGPRTLADITAAHDNLIRLDRIYDTAPGTPLHHDSRPCPLCN